MADRQSRVVVVGMGAVTAAGIGIDTLWSAAHAGKSAIGLAKFDREGPNQVKLAAQVSGFLPEEHVEPARLPYCDRFTQFAIAAAQEATLQAGLPRGERLGSRTAVILGTGVGGITTIDDVCYAEYVLKSRTSPLAVPRIMGSAAVSHVSIIHGCTGPTFAVTSACASAAQAIGLGASLIRSGVVDRAIVGGSESSMTPMNIRVWELLRVLTPDACRPFSIKRNGMVLGEGAAVFVLESERVALARKASPLAELAGYGTASDAMDIVRPDPAGATAAMELAIADAGLTPSDIDYVNAHGTGTIANDVAETEALQRVFGNRFSEIAISSTKPIHGHVLGATGAIELAVTIMALRNNSAPPTINWIDEDPECRLNPVANTPRDLPIRAAMSNSFAFGGINACLIVSAVN